jgi:outer membrane immunogenic protein
VPALTVEPSHSTAREANGFHSIFPGVNGAGSSTNSVALLVGRGTNVALSRHLAVRALDAAWLRTQLPNATTNAQNNVRVGAGAVFKFR